MKFYKRDPDAALSGMAELTLQERGAYNTIIDLLYARDGAVPDDDEVLRRMVGCHGNEWRAVKVKLLAKGKIWVEDGRLKARRVDEVLNEAAAFSDAQRKRAERRWQIDRKLAGNSPETRRKLAGNGEDNSELFSNNNDAVMPNTSTPISTPRKDPPSGSPPQTTKANGLNGGNGHERGTRLAADWEPTPEDREFARAQGLDDGLVRDAFRDYWHAATGARATKRDWSATWRNWCRNQSRMDAERRSRTGQRGPMGFGQAAATLIRRYEREGSV